MLQSGSMFDMAYISNALLELGASVRIRRKALHLTQSDVADLVGVKRQTVGRLENGDPTVAVGTALAIIETLGLGSLPSVPDR